MAKKKKPNYRTWLHPANHYNSKSFVLVEFSDTHGRHDPHQFIIGDCDKHIGLEFEASKRGKAKALAKLAKVQKALDLIKQDILTYEHD
jgi:hypothetical protein